MSQASPALSPRQSIAVVLLLSCLALLFAAVMVMPSGLALAEPRAPQAAGRFYPAGQSELLDFVTELMENQPEPVRNDKPRILIAPHAGYEYSGGVAGYAFRHLKGHRYDGVVVVGFTHRMQFAGASVDTREAYQTPLGLMPVDSEAAEFLQRQPGITHLEAAHAQDEHSLEVLLPFLHVALGEFRLIPILMGGWSLEEADDTARALAALARRGDYLFVFSTDLSHYHPAEDAEALDELLVNAVLFETPQAVHRLFDRGAFEACGRGPVVTSLLLAARLGYPERVLLRYAHSGETAGNRASVVGYAALGMFDRAADQAPLVSEEAGQALVRAARQTLERTVGGRTVPDPVDLSHYPDLAQAHGVFVTLRKGRALRGCIGRIETQEPLVTTLPMVSLEAAVRDPRFRPVEADELDSLHLEVSVLTPRRRLGGPSELVAGRDGVHLELGQHHGVFLPTVWDETGWTRLEFLRELASQKAGLQPEQWREATLYVFQDQVFEEPSVDPSTDAQDGTPNAVEGFDSAQDGSPGAAGEPLPLPEAGSSSPH